MADRECFCERVEGWSKEGNVPGRGKKEKRKTLGTDSAQAKGTVGCLSHQASISPFSLLVNARISIVQDDR